MRHMWQCEGSTDASGKTLTLEAESPNFTEPGRTALFRDVYEFKSKDHIVQTSAMQDKDGKWTTFMTGNMRRKN
ncbi:MAG: DUF1579 family protein [Pirellulales bacterium]